VVFGVIPTTSILYLCSVAQSGKSTFFHIPSSIFHLPSPNIQNTKKTSSTQQAVENQSFRQQQKRKLPITAGIISCPPELIKTVVQNMDRLNSMRIHTSAREYLKAASDLFDHGWIDPIPPIIFLVGQSIELSLKAFLRGAGFKDSQLRIISHDIEEAFRKAKENGIERHFNEKPDDITLIRLINLPYKSKDLQYVKTGIKTRPSVQPILELAGRLNQSLEEFCFKNKDWHVGKSTSC
jgi:HEPN domain-containing protein